MRHRRIGFAIVLVAFSLLTLLAFAGPKDFWEAKPYSEWTAKEVEKILLKDSPWTRVLLLNASSSSVSIGGTSKGGGGSGGPPPIYINWYSRPIREAVVRNLQLVDPKVNSEQLSGILNSKPKFIQFMLTNYSPGGRSRGGAGSGDEAMERFRKDTYLQKKSGKIPLANFLPATRTSAAFLQFPLEVDGVPTVSPEDKDVTLVIRINEGVYKFKFEMAKMMVKEKLEI